MAVIHKFCFLQFWHLVKDFLRTRDPKIDLVSVLSLSLLVVIHIHIHRVQVLL